MRPPAPRARRVVVRASGRPAAVSSRAPSGAARRRPAAVDLNALAGGPSHCRRRRRRRQPTAAGSRWAAGQPQPSSRHGVEGRTRCVHSCRAADPHFFGICAFVGRLQKSHKFAKVPQIPHSSGLWMVNRAAAHPADAAAARILFKRGARQPTLACSRGRHRTCVLKP